MFSLTDLTWRINRRPRRCLRCRCRLACSFSVSRQERVEHPAGVADLRLGHLQSDRWGHGRQERPGGVVRRGFRCCGRPLDAPRPPGGLGESVLGWPGPRWDPGYVDPDWRIEVKDCVIVVLLV
jgi:hypothetical protein